VGEAHRGLGRCECGCAVTTLHAEGRVKEERSLRRPDKHRIAPVLCYEEGKRHYQGQL